MIKKKNSIQDDSGITQDEQQALSQLADAVSDKWQGSAEHLDDPFEEYVHKCLGRVCCDRHAFKGKLGRGYRALVIELSSKNSGT